MFALTLIGQCKLKQLKILGVELKLSEAIAGYGINTCPPSDELPQSINVPRLFVVLEDSGLQTLASGEKGTAANDCVN